MHTTVQIHFSSLVLLLSCSLLDWWTVKGPFICVNLHRFCFVLLVLFCFLHFLIQSGLQCHNQICSFKTFPEAKVLCSLLTFGKNFTSWYSCRWSIYYTVLVLRGQYPIFSVKHKLNSALLTLLMRILPWTRIRINRVLCCKYLGTVFPRIVSAETVLFWI